VSGDVSAKVFQKRIWNSTKEIDADVLHAPVKRLRIQKIAYEFSVLLDFFILFLLLHDLSLLWLQRNCLFMHGQVGVKLG
jgi:hypothetical protein